MFQVSEIRWFSSGKIIFQSHLVVLDTFSAVATAVSSLCFPIFAERFAFSHLFVICHSSWVLTLSSRLFLHVSFQLKMIVTLLETFFASFLEWYHIGCFPLCTLFEIVDALWPILEWWRYKLHSSNNIWLHTYVAYVAIESRGTHPIISLLVPLSLFNVHLCLWWFSFDWASLLFDSLEAAAPHFLHWPSFDFFSYFYNLSYTLYQKLILYIGRKRSIYSNHLNVQFNTGYHYLFHTQTCLPKATQILLHPTSGRI